MGYGKKTNRWNQFQNSMIKMPSMPKMPSMEGGKGQMGLTALGSGYNKAARFGSQPDVLAFLKKYSMGYKGSKKNLSEPKDLLKF